MSFCHLISLYLYRIHIFIIVNAPRMSLDCSNKDGISVSKPPKKTPNLRSIASMSQSYIYIFTHIYIYHIYGILYLLISHKKSTIHVGETYHFSHGCHGSSIRILAAQERCRAEIPEGTERRRRGAPRGGDRRGGGAAVAAFGWGGWHPDPGGWLGLGEGGKVGSKNGWIFLPSMGMVYW